MILIFNSISSWTLWFLKNRDTLEKHWVDDYLDMVGDGDEVEDLLSHFTFSII